MPTKKQAIGLLLAGPEVTTPLGRVSVSGAVRLATVASGLLKVMVSVEVPAHVTTADELRQNAIIPVPPPDAAGDDGRMNANALCQ